MSDEQFVEGQLQDDRPTLDLDLQVEFSLADVPVHADDVERYVRAALHTVGMQDDCDLAVRLVDTAESHALNHEYRGKDKPTNVLSFASDIPDEIVEMIGVRSLGDLVICLPVVLAEAQAQAKPVVHHLAHLIVHGTLHLLGYDHETGEDDAAHMEGLEIGTMARLYLPNPYAD